MRGRVASGVVAQRQELAKAPEPALAPRRQGLLGDRPAEAVEIVAH
jgi:hypothetical protein